MEDKPKIKQVYSVMKMEVKEILIIIGLLIFAVTVAILVTGEIPSMDFPSIDISSIFDKETPQIDLTMTTINSTNNDTIVNVTETQPMAMTANMTMGYGGGAGGYYNYTDTTNMTIGYVYAGGGGGGSFDPAKDKLVPV
jgi:hypothetical protein